MLNEYLLCEVLTKTKFKVFAFSLMIVVLEWIKHFLSKKAGTVNAKIQTVYFGKLGISKMGDGSPSGEMALKLGLKDWENRLRKQQTVVWREQAMFGHTVTDV